MVDVAVAEVDDEPLAEVVARVQSVAVGLPIPQTVAPCRCSFLR